MNLAAIQKYIHTSLVLHKAIQGPNHFIIAVIYACPLGPSDLLMAGALTHMNYCCAPNNLPEEKGGITNLCRCQTLTVFVVASDIFVMFYVWYLKT